MNEIISYGEYIIKTLNAKSVLTVIEKESLIKIQNIVDKYQSLYRIQLSNLTLPELFQVTGVIISITEHERIISNYNINKFKFKYNFHFGVLTHVITICDILTNNIYEIIATTEQITEYNLELNIDNIALFSFDSHIYNKTGYKNTSQNLTIDKDNFFLLKKIDNLLDNNFLDFLTSLGLSNDLSMIVLSNAKKSNIKKRNQIAEETQKSMEIERMKQEQKNKQSF